MNIKDLPELTSRQKEFWNNWIEIKNRTYKIDAEKIPENLLFEINTLEIYFDGTFYFYTGTDERIKQYKI
jgi:hypothetical protein